MSLQIYNSLTRQKEPFVPHQAGHVSMYVCGPTVYGEPHFGNAKTYASFDVILRYLQYSGYTTSYVQNVTDVGHLTGDSDEGEDKLLKKSREVKQDPMAIAEYYTRAFFRCMDALGLQRPDISPRATGHIPEQLKAIKELVDKDIAYLVNGSVYFDVSKCSGYGELSNRNTDDMLSGTRVEVRDEKRNPSDFALWKKAEDGHLMRWDDPWGGEGFPGWHTECVVMSAKYLGHGFDIHGGGMDLQFPHHEAELAQARCMGQEFAKYWMHVNMLTIGGKKMGKSLGNVVDVTEACEKWGAMTVRYFIVASHYRSVVDYSEHALQSAQSGLARLQDVTQALRQKIPQDAKASGQHFQDYRERFCEAMDDDFSTPQALAVLFDLSKAVNTMLAEDSPNVEALVDAEALFSTLGGQVLGVISDGVSSGEGQSDKVEPLMDLVINLRKRFRDNKDYATSDFIRDQLQAIEIQLKDGKDGTTWSGGE